MSIQAVSLCLSLSIPLFSLPRPLFYPGSLSWLTIGHCGAALLLLAVGASFKMYRICIFVLCLSCVCDLWFCNPNCPYCKSIQSMLLYSVYTPSMACLSILEDPSSVAPPEICSIFCPKFLSFLGWSFSLFEGLRTQGVIMLYRPLRQICDLYYWTGSTDSST